LYTKSPLREDELVRWSISSGPRKQELGTLPEGIQNQVRAIEKFAPREYAKERRVHYYNYGILAEYQKPLHDLLSAISECKGPAQKGDTVQLLKALFCRMKGFYDPKQRLSLDQAIEDRELRRRLRQVLLIFYKKEKTADSEIRSCLQELAGGEKESRPK
jgi:hypothetical protein